MRAHNILSCERLKDYTKYSYYKISLISSNYLYLEHIYMVPKVFESLKFYCNHCNLELQYDRKLLRIAFFIICLSQLF